MLHKSVCGDLWITAFGQLDTLFSSLMYSWYNGLRRTTAMIQMWWNLQSLSASGHLCYNIMSSPQREVHVLSLQGYHVHVAPKLR